MNCVTVDQLVIGQWYWVIESGSEPSAMFYANDTCCGPHSYEQTFDRFFADQVVSMGGQIHGPIPLPQISEVCERR